MKFIKIIILLGTFLMVNVSIGQLPNIAPLPPEAASLFKFTEVPVSLYTGTANITIPLFDVDVLGVKIPVSISYHSRGIKVDEIASSVGIGWTLNYGGMLSRQVRGGIDEHTNYPENSFGGNFYTSRTKRQSTFSEEGIDLTDFLMPDQYYFNVNNLSGKFIYDYRQKDFLVQKYDQVKIEKIENYFNVTDNTGTIYTFGGLYGNMNQYATGYDSSQSSIIIRENNPDPIISTDDSESRYISSWYLSNIKTANNIQIKYLYESDETFYKRRSYDKYEPSTATYESHISHTRSEQKRIKEILFETGKLVFEYSIEPREDLQDGKSLKSIKLYDKHDNVVKETQFEYNFISSVANDANNVNWYLTNDSYASKRMFLKSVQIKSGDSLMPKYKFEYDSAVLPSRHSNSQDTWGYYNGKENGKFLRDGYSDMNLGRAVDPVLSTAGLLHKIIYPEGGSINFQYEHNIGMSTFPSTVHFPDPNPVIVGNLTLSHFDHTDPFVYNGGTYIKPFEIKKKNSQQVKFKIDYQSNGCGCAPPECSPGYTNDCKLLFSISKQNFDGSWGTYNRLFHGNYYISLTDGNYRMKVEGINGIHDPIVNTFMVLIDWKEIIASDIMHDLVDADDPSTPLFEGNTLLYAAGKRIKKIEHRNSDNVIGLTKTYDYSMNGGFTSGFILGLENFSAVKHSQNLGGQTVLIYAGFSAGGGSPFSSYQGNSIGYKTVTEYIGEGSNTVGKSVYSFSIIPDSGKYFEFPYHPPTDNEWLRGKELSIIHYKKLGDEFIPIKKIENKYLFADNINSLGVSYANDFLPLSVRNPIDVDIPPDGGYIRNRRLFRLPLSLVTAQLEEYDSYKTYYLTGGTMDLLSTKTTDYFDGLGELHTETKYTYNYDEHYNTASVSQTGSDGNSNTTKYFYPADILMVGKPARQDLIDRNIVSVPLLTQNFKGTDLLSQQETTYKNWDNVMLAPEFMKSSKGDKPLETRVEYVKVDPSNGNPLEVKQSGGMSICYIWGYNKTKPIAKIENVTYATVASYVSNLQTLSNGQNETALIGALNSLRTALPNAMVTTFSYKPLIGVSTITNPSGQKTTYDYDNFGRLKSVKDHNGHLLSENKYHYAAPTN